MVNRGKFPCLPDTCPQQAGAGLAGNFLGRAGVEPAAR